MNKQDNNKKIFVIATGKISGIYADSFHKLSSDGKTGYYLDRDPTSLEREQMLFDIRRHREQLMYELINLGEAEKLLLKEIDID